MKIDKNLPNYLTILRIISIPVILMSFYFEDSKFDQCLCFFIQISQNSEPHCSHEISCPGRYPVKQLSHAVPFIGIFGISTLKMILDSSKGIQKDL